METDRILIAQRILSSQCEQCGEDLEGPHADLCPIKLKEELEEAHRILHAYKDAFKDLSRVTDKLKASNNYIVETLTSSENKKTVEALTGYNMEQNKVYDYIDCNRLDYI